MSAGMGGDAILMMVWEVMVALIDRLLSRCLRMILSDVLDCP